MRRVFSFGLVLVFIMLVFSGCKTDSTAKAVSGLPDEICFVNGKYCIVRPESDAGASDACAKLYKSIKETSGIKLTNISEANDSTDKEIIVGNTARSETSEARKLLKEKGTGRKGEYIICVLDENIVIYGNSDEALVSAVDKFLSDYCETVGYTVKTDLCFVYTITDMPDIFLNGDNIGTYDIVVPQYNRSYYTVMRINDIIDYVYSVTGIELNVTEDNCESETKHSIVIGDCTRDGVIKETYNENYSVRTENGNIYINGGRNYSLARGVEILLDTLKTGNDVTVTDQSGSFDGRNDSGYSLVWQDEFDNVDASKWIIENTNYGNAPRVNKSGFGSWYGMNTARSNKPENLSSHDGKLYITGTFDDETFYGAKINSKMSFTYGYAEISARLADGSGLWHAFWVHGYGARYFELDVMECWSYADYCGSFLHEWDFSERDAVDLVQGEVRVLKDTAYLTKSDINSFHQRHTYAPELSMNMEYHTFGFEWTEEDITCYRDGEKTLYYYYRDTENADIYSQPYFFILSMLVGSNYLNYTTFEEGQAATTKNPILDADYWSDDRASFIVDYIQLYQKPGQTVIINGETYN